jgi:hypothetical protein
MHAGSLMTQPGQRLSSTCSPVSRWGRAAQDLELERRSRYLVRRRLEVEHCRQCLTRPAKRRSFDLKPELSATASQCLQPYTGWPTGGTGCVSCLDRFATACHTTRRDI